MKHSFLGLAAVSLFAGIVLEATDSFLRLWGREAGLSLSSLGWLSVLHMLYALKFLWAPLLSRGPKKSNWILILLCIGGGVMMLLPLFPFFSIPFVLLVAVLTIIHANIDMLVVASQRDAASISYWGICETVCLTGYQVGMIALGSCALLLSAKGWSWELLSFCAGLSMLLGAAFLKSTNALSFIKGSASTAGFLWPPLKNWFSMDSWISILALMVLYRAQDGLLDPVHDLFLLSLGISKPMIVGTSKILGLFASMIGGALASLFLRYGGFRQLLMSGIAAHALSILLLLFLQSHITLLMPLIFTEKILRSFSLVGFFSFQLTCCQEKHAITQLAFLTAVNAFSMYCFGGLSGLIIDTWGWHFFFLSALVSNIPAVFCIYAATPSRYTHRN
jgi:PAT family beta-lactamase induction signal transducer AmpG